MRYISAVGGEQLMVDDEDFAEYSAVQWRVDYRDKMGQLMREPSCVRRAIANGRCLHRIMLKPPTGMFVDHANGNVLDNRRSNLRVCTEIENIRNRRVSNRSQSGYKGVFTNSNLRSAPGGKPWEAAIRHNGKRYRLGTFWSKEQAHTAYLVKAEELFGAFNPPVFRHIKALLPTHQYIRKKLTCLWHECGKSFDDPGHVGKPGRYCCEEHRALDKLRRDRLRYRGYQTCVAYGMEEAQAALLTYLGQN